MVDSKGKEACECDPTLRIEGASLPHPQVELRSDDQHHVFEASLEPSDPGEASHLQPVEDKDLPHPSMPDQKAVELPVHGQAPAELTSGININNSNTSIQPDGIEMHDGTPDLNNNNSVAEPKPLLDNKDEPADAYLLNNNSAETKIDQDMNLKPHNDMTEETNIAPDAKQLFTAKSEGSNVHHSDYHPLEIEPNDDKTGKEIKEGVATMEFAMHTETINEQLNSKLDLEPLVAVSTPNKSFHRELSVAEGYESGTEEEQAAFRKDVENFYRENSLEFKAPKFYKEELNLLKLWRQVIKLGGYEQVTSCKLWRQVGESFRPPKTCTTVSWTFRIFYEKALLEYEKHKLRSGELPFSDGLLPESLKGESQSVGNQALGSGRARRDAAARAMQGWHSQRLLDNGEVCHPIIKDKNLGSATKVDKQLKTNGAGLLKRKKPSSDEHTVNVAPIKTMKPQLGSDTMVIDIGPPADWVKINVQKMNDCFEIYALVPGLLREEVHVQSDPAGRLIISGQPEQVDNPWGITPFKKVVSLPSRIDPHQTSAVVTLHGQLFVRVPFEQSGH